MTLSLACKRNSMHFLIGGKYAPRSFRVAYQTRNESASLSEQQLSPFAVSRFHFLSRTFSLLRFVQTRSIKVRPSVAQLAERWTVEEEEVLKLQADIHRSPVQLRFEGFSFCFIFICFENNFSFKLQVGKLWKSVISLASFTTDRKIECSYIALATSKCSFSMAKW